MKTALLEFQKFYSNSKTDARWALQNREMMERDEFDNLKILSWPGIKASKTWIWDISPTLFPTFKVLHHMCVPAKCTLQLTYFNFAESNALHYERQSTKVGTTDKTFTFQFINIYNHFLQSNSTAVQKRWLHISLERESNPSLPSLSVVVDIIVITIMVIVVKTLQ